MDVADAFDAIFANKQADQVPAIQPPEQPPIEAPAAVEEATPAPAAEVTPEAQEAAPPAPEPAPQEKGDKIVPLAALLDERDKRKALEARLAELERAQAQAQPAGEAPAIPDPYDDPQGYNAFLNDVVQRQVLAVKIDISEEMAKSQHGDEAVEAAKEWALEQARTRPGFQQQFLNARNPMDWVVRQHRQELDMELLRSDPVAFARQLLERNGQPVTDATAGAVSAVVQQTPAPQSAPPPPRSLASVTSTGAISKPVLQSPEAVFDAVFASKR